MAKRLEYDYKHMKAVMGKEKAIKRCLEIIREKHPPKRERIVIP